MRRYCMNNTCVGKLNIFIKMSNNKQAPMNMSFSPAQVRVSENLRCTDKANELLAEPRWIKYECVGWHIYDILTPAGEKAKETGERVPLHNNLENSPIIPDMNKTHA